MVGINWNVLRHAEAPARDLIQVDWRALGWCLGTLESNSVSGPRKLPTFLLLAIGDIAVVYVLLLTFPVLPIKKRTSDVTTLDLLRI